MIFQRMVITAAYQYNRYIMAGKSTPSLNLHAVAFHFGLDRLNVPVSVSFLFYEYHRDGFFDPETLTSISTMSVISILDVNSYFCRGDPKTCCCSYLRDRPCYTCCCFPCVSPDNRGQAPLDG